MMGSGVPAGAVTMELPLPFSDAFKIMTAHSTAWAVLTDLADYTGCYVNVDLLSRITISTNTIWHPELMVYPNRTWDRSNLATVQFIGERRSPTAQVQMQRMNADGSLAETLTYPAQMDAVGDHCGGARVASIARNASPVEREVQGLVAVEQTAAGET